MDVAAVYLQVMRSVIDGVRADFSTEQLDEAALTALAKVLFTRKTEKTTFSHDVFDSFGKKKYSRRGPCSKKLSVNLLRARQMLINKKRSRNVPRSFQAR